MVSARDLDELAGRCGGRQLPGGFQDRVVASGGEQHGLEWRLERIGISIAQAHALRECDEHAQIVAGDALGEGDIVLGDRIGDRGARFGEYACLLDVQSRERAPVRDAAENAASDAIGRVHESCQPTRPPSEYPA